MGGGGERPREDENVAVGARVEVVGEGRGADVRRDIVLGGGVDGELAVFGEGDVGGEPVADLAEGLVVVGHEILRVG